MASQETEHKKGPVTKLKEELERVKQEAKDNYDKYLRAVAEFDNYRKRVQRENEEFREFAQASLLLDLVPVLENFDRALAHIELGIDNPIANESTAQGNEKITQKDAEETSRSSQDTVNQPDPNWLKGVKIIYNQLKDILAKYGFQEYSCLGEEFDPKRCEAIGYIETDEKPPHIVIEEVGKGYLLKGKVLRPALVIVSKAKSPQSSVDQNQCQEGA
ncbi:MAG: nucleotide exchange factor GrpE [candidate division WOR-3 bacterium]